MKTTEGDELVALSDLQPGEAPAGSTGALHDAERPLDYKLAEVMAPSPALLQTTAGVFREKGLTAY